MNVGQLKKLIENVEDDALVISVKADSNNNGIFTIVGLPITLQLNRIDLCEIPVQYESDLSIIFGRDKVELCNLSKQAIVFCSAEEE